MVEYVPAVQDAHEAVGIPEPVRYFPAAQAWHVDPRTAPRTVEYVPATHRLQATPMPVPAENVPATQAWHVVSAVALRFVEYVPARHWIHWALLGMPTPIWYVPAMHDRQV